MATKNNTICLNSLKQDSVKFFKRKQVSVKSLSGKSYTMEIAENIKESDVDDAVAKMVEMARYCKENDIDVKLLPLQYIALLKLYTNLPFMIGDNTEEILNNDIALIKEMIDLGLYGAVLDIVGEERCNRFADMLYAREDAIKKLNDSQVASWLMADKITIGGHNE